MGHQEFSTDQRQPYMFHELKNRWKRTWQFLMKKHLLFHFMISNLNKKFLVQTTLLENLKLCPNIQFSEKFKIAKWNLWAKNKWLWKMLNARFTWIICIFAPKIVILRKYRINNNRKCWTLTVFSVKIQILIEIIVS